MSGAVATSHAQPIEFAADNYSLDLLVSLSLSLFWHAYTSPKVGTLRLREERVRLEKEARSHQ